MAINPHNRGPLRTLSVLIVIVFGLYGLLAAVHVWGEAQLSPKLGLDLQGGTQLILVPKIVGNQAIDLGQVEWQSTSSARGWIAPAIAEARSHHRVAPTSWSHCQPAQQGPHRLAAEVVSDCVSGPSWSRPAPRRRQFPPN